MGVGPRALNITIIITILAPTLRTITLCLF